MFKSIEYLLLNSSAQNSINLLSKSFPPKLMFPFTAFISYKPSSIEIIEILKVPLPKLKKITICSLWKFLLNPKQIEEQIVKF